jgi:cell pole-organizing protein PopZ
MGDLRNEPSMEDILASIKRIIAEDGATALNAPRGKAALRDEPASPAVGSPEEAEAEAVAPSPEHPAAPETPPLELNEPVAPPAAATLVSPNAAQASRQSLATLSAMVIRPDPEAESPPGNTLEAMVRELLRPMLKDWLDAKLPELVEALVSREIARITGKSL